MSNIQKTLEQLRELLNAADKEAIRWGRENEYLCSYDTDSDDEDYIRYRNSCFNKIDKTWWKIASSIGITSKEWRTYQSAEQNMRDSLGDFEDDNPEWLLDVLEKLEVEE